MDSPVTQSRKDMSRAFAENMGLDPDELHAAAWAAWSNLNPQSVPFSSALSVAGVALKAAQDVRRTSAMEKFDADQAERQGR